MFGTNKLPPPLALLIYIRSIFSHLARSVFMRPTINYLIILILTQHHLVFMHISNQRFLRLTGLMNHAAHGTHASCQKILLFLVFYAKISFHISYFFARRKKTQICGQFKKIYLVAFKKPISNEYNFTDNIANKREEHTRTALQNMK
jgi:hypothetical protein